MFFGIKSRGIWITAFVQLEKQHRQQGSRSGEILCLDLGSSTLIVPQMSPLFHVCVQGLVHIMFSGVISLLGALLLHQKSFLLFVASQLSP